MVVLPQPVGPTMAMLLTGLDVQVEALNQRAIRHIAEADVFEVNRALGGEQGGVFLVRHAIILIQQGENARGAGEGVLRSVTTPEISLKGLAYWLA